MSIGFKEKVPLKYLVFNFVIKRLYEFVSFFKNKDGDLTSIEM